MAEQRQEFWPVPYLSKLQGKIEPGQLLTIKGLVTGKRFDVNLQSGGQSPSNIQLHVSVRANEKQIVLNTLHNGQWEKEERLKDPFKPGQPFDLRIRAHADKFEIHADQHEIGNFNFRQALDASTHLFIEGELELHSVSWGGRYYPVPYESKFDGGLRVGRRLFISGVPEKNKKRFNIDLTTGNGDKALHFNVRFDEKAVVRNSFSDGKWHNEEREGKFVFDKNTSFDIIIANEQQGFTFFINGTQWGKFAHRSDPNQINGIEVGGDIELHGVYLK